MKFSLGMAALVALGVTLAGRPWRKRTACRPRRRPPMTTPSSKCKDLAAPFKNGMLSGKFPFPDENVTQQMLTNENYPTAAEAVVLHGYVEASNRCENIQRAFIVKYMPFDLKDAMFIYDAEQPVLNALMARKITYGKAARDIYNIESEGQARRARDWPQAAQAQARAKQNAAAKAALQQVNRKCLDLIAPFRNGVLDGKIPLGDDAGDARHAGL